ncbi:MAG: TRAP transporter substrate-binding protein [Clostridiales bacterium]|nr:TRAP transporter substrate-binding protein [Clostridiales bacterium]
MMRLLKRWSLAAVLACICVLGTSCGNSDGGQTYAWPLATCSSGDTVTNVFAQTFADYVSELSDGEMRIQVYTDSTLGTDTELMETCEDGDIPFVVQSPSPQVSYMPELCVFDTPCVFSTVEEVRANLDNEELMDSIKEIYTASGYRLLGMTDQGFRVMTMNKEYTSLDSLAGQKIRVMENKFHIQFWKCVSANPTPMTFSEVYIGLQQGTIDAQENALPLIVSAKLYEQQKYLIETNAVPDYITLIASDKFMSGLTEEQQEIINTAAEMAQQDAYVISDEKGEESMEYLADAGIEIITPSEEDYAEMKELSQPVWESIEEQCGSELFAAYTAIAEE